MNIGIFISRLTKTGPVNLVYDLLASTKNLPVKFIIFTLRPEAPQNTRKKDFEVLNIPVHCLHSKWQFKIFLNLKKNLLVHNIDVVHGHCFRSFFFLSFLKKKKIFTVHNNFYHDYPLNHGKIGRAMVIFEHMLLSKWDKIICCSKHLELLLRKKTGKKNIFHVVNGRQACFVMNQCHKDKNDFSAINTYIYVGSIDKRKNVKLLCEQFSRNALPNEKLICAGSGSDLELIRQMNYPNVEMLGFVENIPEILSIADYFVSIAISEGLPLAVIEALSCGLPVILSDIPSHRDFFSLNDKIGVLVTGDDLKHALEKVRISDYKEMSQQAYNTYMKHLTAEKMTAQYIMHYQTLSYDSVNFIKENVKKHK